MSRLRPLHPWIYLTRNPRRVLPLLGIQALVTALLVAIITPTNAFRATYEASTRALEHFTIVTSARFREIDPELEQVLDANPAQGRRLAAKMLWMHTPMIVGKNFAPLVAVAHEERADLLARLGLRLVDGTLPEDGSAGATIHEALLRARGLWIGDAFGRRVDETDATPGRFEIVGVLAGPTRIGLVDLAYASRPQSVLARTDAFQLVYAAPGRKDESDAYLREARDAEGEPAFRVVDARFIRERIEEDLANLPVVIGFITFTVAAVVALVVALLTVIAFQVRVEEFGLHLAVGHRRATLVRKLVAETGLVALAGWLLGLAAGLALVSGYDELVLAPRGILMRVPDPQPLLFSLSVPLLSGLVSALALRRRLHRMDPVAVIQRRGG